MKKIILFNLLVLMASACDDILEEVPKNFISSENFYQTTLQIEDALKGAYHAIWYEVGGDDFIHVLELHNDWSKGNGSFTSIGNFDQPLSSNILGKVDRVWRGYFRQINRANIVLKRALLVEDMNEATRLRILAEAHFLRAFAYFDLLRYFGPPPIKTEEFNGASELGVPRASKDQVYDLIIDDLLIAEKDCRENVGNDTGIASKMAAKMLLALVYLDMENWTKAAEKAEEIINSNQFTLVSVKEPDDFYKIFAIKSTCSEEIMAYHFSANLKPVFMQNLLGVGTPYNRGVTWGFTNFPNMGSPFILNWDKKDLRKDFNLFSSYLNNDGDSVYLTGVGSTRYKKYIKDPNGDGLYNIPIYRLANAYLIYAEASCMATGNPSTLALERLNIIKRRGYGYDPYSPSPIDFPTGMSKDEFRDAVIQERGYEFFWEYSRWWDLKRTGKAKDLITEASGKKFIDARLLFPLPLVEIEANPMISPSDQNPGY